MVDPMLALGIVASLALLGGVAWRLHLFRTYLHFVRAAREGHLEEADRLFDRLLVHLPRLLEGSPMLGQAALDVRLLGAPVSDDRMRSFFHGLASRGRKARPAATIFLRLEANLLRQEGDLEQGLPLIQEAARLGPGDPTNVQQQGWFHELSGDLERAAEDYVRALELLPAGGRPVRQRASLLRSLSQARTRQGRLEDAIQALRQAVEAEPCTTEGVFTRVALAGLHERLGRAEEAVAILKEGVAQCSDGTLLRQTLATVLVRAGRHDEAEEELEAAAAAGLDPVALHLARAEIETARSRPDEALAHLEEAAAVEPRNPAVQLALSRHYDRLGDDGRAMVHLERAVEGATGEGPWKSLRDAIWQSPRERLADCYARLGRLEDAEREYRRALKEGAANPSLKASLGAVLVRLGKVSEGQALQGEARLALEASLRRVPGDPRLHQALASLLLEAGEVEAAQAHLEEALTLGPGDFFTWRDLGRAHFQSGRRAEAREAWEKALPLAGRADLEQQLRESLDRLGD